ncbi:hypothetical protein K1719_019396 [Acacia pycnantha]|nr:hypothetical protein K1719_019396 [Acacia pycnantha]
MCEGEIKVNLSHILLHHLRYKTAVIDQETHFKEGYDEGYKDGLITGKDESKQVGLKVGFEVGEELGFYRGCVDVWALLSGSTQTAFLRGLKFPSSRWMS